ncbi:hypothetical protein [Mesorhizobium sp. KR2-14]|uniref:hypothetical protein n=1 Tax=Mesorhizobium sp. KR2-14 TaxID=3156610 RepID=UPI0032B460B6
MKRIGTVSVFIATALVSACTADKHPEQESRAVLPAKTADPAAASAPPKLVETYTTHISEKDKFDNNGKRLTSAKEIVLQDRKNFYDFNLRDPNDRPDKFFSSKPNRWGETTPVHDWRMGSGVEYEVQKGNPNLKVQVYDNGHINVKIEGD